MPFNKELCSLWAATDPLKPVSNCRQSNIRTDIIESTAYMPRKYVWGLELPDFLVSFDQYVRYQLDRTEANA